MQDIGFDILSDLNLAPNDSFNWTNKASSLYCILAGNVSSNFRTVAQVLVHLSTCYQGVFYVPGELEYVTTDNIIDRTEDIAVLCDKIPNVVLLHQNVAVIDGVAIIGANGWNNSGNLQTVEEMFRVAARYEDFKYLSKTIEKLQRHLDVKHIIVVSSAVPREDLYYGEEPTVVYDQTPLYNILCKDTEHKVKHWVFGTYSKLVDTTLENINYVNNPYKSINLSIAKRLTVSV